MKKTKSSARSINLRREVASLTEEVNDLRAERDKFFLETITLTFQNNVLATQLKSVRELAVNRMKFVHYTVEFWLVRLAGKFSRKVRVWFYNKYRASAWGIVPYLKDRTNKPQVIPSLHPTTPGPTGSDKTIDSFPFGAVVGQ